MLTLDQHFNVYRVLDDEQQKAGKALKRAIALYDKASYTYGVTEEREILAVMITLRREQWNAAVIVATQYFDSFIKNKI